MLLQRRGYAQHTFYTRSKRLTPLTRKTGEGGKKTYTHTHSIAGQQNDVSARAGRQNGKAISALCSSCVWAARTTSAQLRKLEIKRRLPNAVLSTIYIQSETSRSLFFFFYSLVHGRAHPLTSLFFFFNFPGFFYTSRASAALINRRRVLGLRALNWFWIDEYNIQLSHIFLGFP